MGERQTDRREYIRVDTDLPVPYKLLSDSPDRIFQYVIRSQFP